MNKLRAALAEGSDFVYTCELIPGRGHLGKGVEHIEQFVSAVKGIPEVKALSITDNAGGNPALLPDVLGVEIHASEIDIIVHFACKDMNRNSIESRAFALQRRGVDNILVLTGDYPVSGFFGAPKPVFDIDSVTALHYLKLMNMGLEVEGPRGTSRLERTSFYLGAVVSPFKWTEGPCMMQYIKLGKKLAAGAEFLVTQLGFDARKLREAVDYVRNVLHSRVPILGSVYVLTAGAAALMNKGEIPGCFVDDAMLATLREEAQAKDKGKQARLDRAARTCAILKGLGYQGAHIEGLALKADDVSFIVGRAAEIGDGWRGHLGAFSCAPPRPFYVFEAGEQWSGDDRERRLPPRTTRSRSVLSLTFWMTRLLHRLIFTPDTPGYRMMVALSGFIDRHRVPYRLFTAMERFAKRALFDCRHCDDCALFEMYYLCPESRCPKGMRIGPCGGSRVDGRCEVFADTWCVWHKVYWRAKNRRGVSTLSYVIPPRNWKLYETNSWVNYFQKRDHSAVKIVLPDPTQPPG